MRGICPQCGLGVPIRVQEGDNPRGGIMAPGNRDSHWEFLERWLSGPPRAPQQVGLMRRWARWCRCRPLLAGCVAFSVFGGVVLWGIALWGWVQSGGTISRLKTALFATQQELAHCQQLIEQQNQQLARQTQRLREAENAAQQAQHQYHQARQQIEQLNTRCDILQKDNVRLQQDLQIGCAWLLARQAQDLVFGQPHRSLLLASEAVRIFQEHGYNPEFSLVQTLLDAFVRLGQGSLEGQPAGISALALSRDGRWLTTATEDRTIRVWKLEGQRPALARVVRAHTGTVHQIFLTPDQRRFITAGQDGRIFLWDLDSRGSEKEPLPIGSSQGPILTSALSADGRWLLTAGGSLFQKEYSARLWDLQAQPPGDRSIVLRGHELPIRCAAFCPNLRWAVTAGEDRTIRLYHLQGNSPAAEQHILTGHQKAVLQVAFSPNGRWLVSAGADGAVRIWDLQALEHAGAFVVLQADTEAVVALAIDAQSRWLATGTTDGNVRLWQLPASDPSASALCLKGHEGPVHCLAFSSDGHMLLSGSADRTVRIWDLTAADPNQKVLILRGHAGAVRLMSLTEDGRLLVTASDIPPDSREPVVRLWRIRSEDLFQDANQIVTQIFNQTEREEILTSHRLFSAAVR